MTRTALVVAALVAALAVPAAARADSKMGFSAGELTFLNEDAGVANKLTVTLVSQGIRYYDPSDPYGISTFPTPPCSPGQVNSQGNPIEIFCTPASVKTATIDLGPNTDTLDYHLDKVPASVSGNTGADHMTTGGANDLVTGDQGNDYIDGGAGDDELRGDDGNDELHGGDGADKLYGDAGADVIDGGAGDDTISVSDGLADTVTCGAGTDTVDADTVDKVAGDCEKVTTQFVAPPAGGAPPADDHKAPSLRAGGSTLQRITLRHRRIRVDATTSEAGLIQITGFVAAGGVNDRLKPSQAKIMVAGGGAELSLGFSRAQVRRVLAGLRRHRSARVRVTVSAVDAAGNTSRPKHFWIRLRR